MRFFTVSERQDTTRKQRVQDMSLPVTVLAHSDQHASVYVTRADTRSLLNWVQLEGYTKNQAKSCMHTSGCPGSEAQRGVAPEARIGWTWLSRISCVSCRSQSTRSVLKFKSQCTCCRSEKLTLESHMDRCPRPDTWITGRGGASRTVYPFSGPLASKEGARNQRR